MDTPIIVLLQYKRFFDDSPRDKPNFRKTVLKFVLLTPYYILQEIGLNNPNPGFNIPGPNLQLSSGNQRIITPVLKILDFVLYLLFILINPNLEFCTQLDI